MKKTNILVGDLRYFDSSLRVNIVSIDTSNNLFTFADVVTGVHHVVNIEVTGLDTAKSVEEVKVKVLGLVSDNGYELSDYDKDYMHFYLSTYLFIKSQYEECDSL